VTLKYEGGDTGINKGRPKATYNSDLILHASKMSTAGHPAKKTIQDTKGAFGCLYTANQAPGMQPAFVWLPGLAPGPGCARARFPSGSGSRKTPESAVFSGPGSLGAAFSLLTMVLVYN
jgi:hypothetical protein